MTFIDYFFEKNCLNIQKGKKIPTITFFDVGK